MAMGQRFGGISSTRPRQSYRPVHEDFQPHFELNEEHDAHIIHVHLPGFLKEQVRITFVHSSSVIRVHGQRPLGHNKWSRFNQTFPVQENSDTSKIHGKFNNGILTITIPKQVITQIGGPKEAATPIQQRPPTPSKASSTTTTGPRESTSSDQKAQNGQEGISQIATAAALDERQEHKRSAAPPSAEGPLETAAEPKAQQSGEGIPLADTFTAAKDEEKDEAFAKVISAIQKEGDEKRVVPLTSPERGTNEVKSQKSRDEIPPKRMNAEAESAVKGVDRKDKSEVNGKPAKNVEKVVETKLHKETETGDISNETRVVPKIVEQANRKNKSFDTAVNQKKSKELDSITANVIVAAKQRMKNLGKRMNNEDKQTLINMGAAVLVLLALGASVTYSFWSAGKAKN